MANLAWGWYQGLSSWSSRPVWHGSGGVHLSIHWELDANTTGRVPSGQVKCPQGQNMLPAHAPTTSPFSCPYLIPRDALCSPSSIAGHKGTAEVGKWLMWALWLTPPRVTCLYPGRRQRDKLGVVPALLSPLASRGEKWLHLDPTHLCRERLTQPFCALGTGEGQMGRGLH